MPSEEAASITAYVTEIVGAAVLLASGTFLTVIAVRDFLLYLDSYDLRMVGTTDGLLTVVLLAVLAWLFIIVGFLIPVTRIARNPEGNTR